MELASSSPTSSLFASRLKIKPATGPPISLSPSPSNKNTMSKIRATTANTPSSSSSLARRLSSAAVAASTSENGGSGISAPQEYAGMRQRPSSSAATTSSGSTGMNSQTLFANIRNGISAAASGASPKFLRGRKMIYSSTAESSPSNNECVEDMEQDGERDNSDDIEDGEVDDYNNNNNSNNNNTNRNAAVRKSYQAHPSSAATTTTSAQQRVLMSKSVDGAERSMFGGYHSDNGNTNTNRLFPAPIVKNTSSSSLASLGTDDSASGTPTSVKELPSLTSPNVGSQSSNTTTSLFSKVGIAASGFNNNNNSRSSATPSPSPSPSPTQLGSAGSSSSSLLPSVSDSGSGSNSNGKGGTGGEGFMTLFNRNKKLPVSSSSSSASGQGVSSVSSPSTNTAVALLSASSFDSENSPRIIVSTPGSLDPSPRDDQEMKKPVSLRPKPSPSSTVEDRNKKGLSMAAFTAAVAITNGDSDNEQEVGQTNSGNDTTSLAIAGMTNDERNGELEEEFKDSDRQKGGSTNGNRNGKKASPKHSGSPQPQQQGKNALRKMPAQQQQQPASPAPRRVRFSDPISFSSTGSATAKTKFDALNTILRLTTGNTATATDDSAAAGVRLDCNSWNADGEVKGILRVKMSHQYAALLHHHNATQQMNQRGNAYSASPVAPPPNLFSVVSPISSTINTINTMNNTLSNKNLSLSVSSLLTTNSMTGQQQQQQLVLQQQQQQQQQRNPRDSMVQKSLQDIHRKLGINQPLPVLQSNNNAMQYSQPYTSAPVTPQATTAMTPSQQQQQPGQGQQQGQVQGQNQVSGTQTYRNGTPIPRRPNTASSVTTTNGASNGNVNGNTSNWKQSSLAMTPSSAQGQGQARPQSASQQQQSSSPSLDDMLNAPLFTLSVKAIIVTAANGMSISTKPLGPVLFYANHCCLPWSPSSSDREKGLTERGIFVQYRDSSTINMIGSKLKIKSTTATPIFFGTCNSTDTAVLVILEMMPSTNYQAVKERLIPMIMSQALAK